MSTSIKISDDYNNNFSIGSVKAIRRIRKMREIKFRGAWKHDRSWIYGFYYRDTWDGGSEAKHFIINKFGKFEVIPETVGQYTGVDDIKGEEIYEDDIVKITYSEGYVIGVVKFGLNVDRNYEDISFYYNGWYIEEKIDCNDFRKHRCKKIAMPDFIPLHPDFSFPEWYDSEIEVIGDIFKNPELLEPILDIENKGGE